MKIVITTPIYPPEMGDPAVYVKELAGRLAEKHSVSVVMYGRLPEKVQGVSFVCVKKDRPLFLRLPAFLFSFLKEAKKADIIFSENGASIELPVGIFSLFSKKPVIFHKGDKLAEKRVEKSSLLRWIESFASKRAKNVVEDVPLKRPEILPFEPEPKEAFEKYEVSWKEHLNKLEEIFKDAK